MLHDVDKDSAKPGEKQILDGRDVRKWNPPCAKMAARQAVLGEIRGPKM